MSRPAAAGPAAPAGTAPPTEPRPRAVLLVANTAAPYSRGLRVARSLAEAGWEVEIAAVTGDGPAGDERDGEILVRRYRPSGPFTPLDRPAAAATPADEAAAGPGAQRGQGAQGGLLAAPRPGLVANAPARAPAGRPLSRLRHPDPAGRARPGDGRPARGRRGIVVYDVIDAILDSNNYQNVPAPVLARYRRAEAGWVRRVDAVVTVNDALADHCQRLWPFRDAADRPAQLPAALDAARPAARPDPRGGRPAARAPDRALPGQARAAARPRDGRRGGDPAARRGPGHARVGGQRGMGRRAAGEVGRPAVRRPPRRPAAGPPGRRPAWAASADVSIIAVPANSLNQRLSTPNKFWESLTAGTPVVIGQDLEVMRAIVEADGLGAVADPADPDDLARALRRDPRPAGPTAHQAMRDRCLAVTRDRYNWETAVGPYLALVASLASAGRKPG